MKPVLVLLLLAGSFAADAQSLKELLYSGKLKNDSNTVIRRTDDLSTKIDTTDRSKPAPEKPTVAVVPATTLINDSNAKAETVQDPSAPVQQTVIDSSTVVAAVDSIAVAPAAAPVKTAAKIWKEYSDSLTVSLKQDVLGNKKIKKDTYYFTVDYELDTNGQVNVTGVTSSPSSDLLTSAILQRLQDSPPQLAPVPRKVKRKYNFTVIKD